MAYSNKVQEKDNLFNLYVAANINSICRICLGNDNKLTAIFDPVKPPHFSVLIMACASVQVQKEDGLPPNICKECISKLKTAFQFRTQCEASDSKLRMCLKRYSLPPPSNYSVLDKVKEENENKTNQTQIDRIQKYIQCAQEAINNEQKVHVQLQPEEIKCETNMITIKLEPLEGDQYIHNESIKECKNEQEDVCQEQEKIEIKIEEPNIGDISDNSTTDSGNTTRHQCIICQKILSGKDSLKNHIRRHTGEISGERTYVCQLCPKRFMTGVHLDNHIKRHAGVKNHICSTCNKGFVTSYELAKHTTVHSSDRPYECTYCTKRFSTSSNLKAHIKIHIGERNFTCVACGKTFYFKASLRQHMFMHTGEKPFPCEHCTRSFGLKCHLKRHMRTHVWIK